MASNNEAKIKFTAETSDFTQAIKDANQEMSQLKAEMRLADATFKNTGDSAEYQQNKLELLQAALEANHDKQEALTAKLEAAKEIYGEDSREVATLEKQLTNAKTEEQNLLNQVNETNGGLDEQKDSAEGAGTAVDDMASILVNAEIAGKVKDIAEAALEMAQNFDEARAAVVEGTGASGESLEGLEQAAQAAFGQIADADTDLQTVAGTLAELNTRFGVTGTEATELTVKMSEFAKATGTDGTKAVDSMADIMHRWGLDLSDTDRLLDDLTTANQSCQLSVDDLTGYLAGNSTQFQELGYSTEEALAMLISLSDGGADVGSVMSGLTKGVANLSSETDDVPGAFRAAVDAIGECGSVSEALQVQVGDTGKTVEQIFGKKAAQELATNIQNGSFAIEEWTGVLADNDGALSTTTDGVTTMQDAWSQACNNVSMALGGTLAPGISDVVTKVSEVITKVAQVVQESPALQAIIIGVATALATLGAALAISAAIQAVTTAFGLLNTAMLTNPIFLVITAIAALAAGLAYAYTHCETFRNAVNQAFEVIKSVVIAALETVRIVISTVFSAIVTICVTTWTNVTTAISAAWTNIKTAVTTAINAVKTTITNIWNAIKSTTSSVWNGIKTAVSNVVNAIKSTVSSVCNAVKSTVTSVWNSIKSTTTSVWNAVKTAVMTPINAAKSAVTNAVNAMRSTASSVFSSIRSTATSVWNGIKTAITSPIESAKNTVKGVLDSIRGFFPISIGNIFSNLRLPHISVSGGSPPFGIGGVGSLPHFSVSWYKTGAIFKKPTIFGTALGWTGVGEAGPEAVAPIDTLKEYVRDAVDSASLDIDYDRLADKVAAACSKMNVTLDVDGRTLGRVVRGLV